MGSEDAMKMKTYKSRIPYLKPLGLSVFRIHIFLRFYKGNMMQILYVLKCPLKVIDRTTKSNTLISI